MTPLLRFFNRRNTATIACCAFLTTMVVGPSHARGTAPEKKPATTEKKDDRPPVGEGVPTTSGNFHLPTPKEIELGRKVAAEVEKQEKVITEGAEYDRLQRISRVIEAAAQQADISAEYGRAHGLPKPNTKDRRVPFEYTFKLVKQDKVVNAFSLAGGPIYVTTGLMEYARSDHELASVLAHEVAHVQFHHVRHLVAKSKKGQTGSILAILAAVLAASTGAGALAFPALTGSQLYQAAKMNGYGRDLEREADRVGLKIMLHTPYHPAAMYTFMRRMARDDALRGNPDMGIYQSHPYMAERQELIAGYLKEHRIALNTGLEREVSNAFNLNVREQMVDGKPCHEVVLNGQPMFRATASDGKRTAEQRATAFVGSLQELLSTGLTLRDVRLGDDRRTIVAKGRTILQVLPADAEANGGTPEAAADKALKLLLTALWKEKLETSF